MSTGRSWSRAAERALLLLIILFTATAGQAQVYEAAGDFTTTANPNGAWTYGWSATRGSTFTNYDTTIDTGSLIGWRRSSTQEPLFIKNITEGVVNPAGTNPIQPGQLVAHPGSSGENSVLRWTAPATDVYQIAVLFEGIDTGGTTTDVAVLHGATQLFSGNVNGNGSQEVYTTIRTVSAGETIDFTVGTGGNGFSNDSTAIDVVILPGAPQIGSPDTQGTEFWLGFLSNLSGPQLSLFITGQSATTGTVEISGLSFAQDFTATPGTVTTVAIPAAAANNNGSNATDNLAIHVVAGAEVTVYGLNRVSATTDAFLGLPVDILGTEYLVMSYGGGAGSLLAVVAAEDNTSVTVNAPGNISTPTLNRGQRYQVFGSDLTGTVITSDKPVAVFGGNVCTNVPPGFFACDHLVEQMPPTVTWGTQFVTMPLATRLGGDTFRILASVDGTTVNVNGTLVATLSRGQFHESIINGPSEIVASNPVLVAQYSNGSGFDNVTSDPFMMLIPPFEQFLNNYTITTPASGFSGNFVNIVTASFALGSIDLDGEPIPAEDFVAIGSSGFFGAQVPISLGSHNLTSPFPFGAFVYGFDSFDSYGYPGGASQSPIATVDSISITSLNPATSEAGTQTCFEALVLDSDEAPVADIRVDFNVSGANTTSVSDTTDESGNAGFCYVGEFGGTDTVRASVGALSSQVNKVWTPGQADVALESMPGPTVSGSNLVYQVRVKNLGPAGASAVVLTDTLTNFQLVGISSTQGSCSGTSGFASCTVGNLRVNNSADVTVTVSATGGAGWARHSFSADGTGVDPDLTNNLKVVSFGNNQAPLAVAGANRVVAGLSASGTAVTLDGSASSDPNGDALTYRWSGPFPEGGGVVTGRTPTVTLALGNSKITLVVSDGALESAPSDVLVTVSDFGVAVGGGPESISAGQSASYSITVSSVHGAFDREVALGCGSLPAFTRCTFSPVKVTPNGTSATATLTITTNATMASAASGAKYFAWLLVFPVAGVVMLAGQRRRRFWLLGGLLALAVLQVACGGSTSTSTMSVSRTPAGVHTITVSGVSGGLTHSTNVIATVR